MNTELLRRVARHITEEPRRLDMEHLYVPAKRLPKEQRPPCGTVCCIAGWAILLGKTVSGFTDLFPQVDGVAQDVHDAAELLRVKNDYLFFLHHWPKTFRENFTAAKAPEQRAAITVARIEHFIKTKGAE